LLNAAFKKPQKDNSQSPSDILNYEHRHVLRVSMNSSWGDTTFAGNIVVNDSTSHTYTLTLNSGRNENKCYVVTYIYDDDPLSATYKEVLQVEEEHIVE
jgi:hypothetical protein